MWGGILLVGGFCGASFGAAVGDGLAVLRVGCQLSQKPKNDELKDPTKSKGSGVIDEKYNRDDRPNWIQNGEAIITPTDQRRDADDRWTDAQDST